MLSNQKALVVYGLTDDEINKIALKNERITKVTSDVAKMKVADILNRCRKDGFSADLPDEKVILFNNYMDYEIQKKVKVIRKNMDGAILAVVTPTSINWTFKDLVDHLIEERDFYKNN